jgi:non-ribosomal peptide synthetase component E (peptide arylation enzyme)
MRARSWFFIPEQFRNFDYPAMLARLRAEVPGRLDSVVVRGRAPGCIVCAFVIPRLGQTVDVAALAAFLEKAGLARQKFPEHVEVVDDLPRTASGKVQKNVLRERIATRLAT